MQPPDDSPSPGLTDARPRTQATSSDAPEAVSASDLIGRVVGERYRVLETLGSGGMGAVYRAEHIHMRKPVALKVLHRELTRFAEIVARFEREAIAAARIAHPNVAAATDFGRLPDGACYLVLEYVHGKSLRRAMIESGPFDADRAGRIGRQIALALAAAHEAGIVHRDLKPENVMLVDGGEPDIVKVLDFGIAKIHMPEQADQPALTRVGTIFGTPEYMSPEQALGQAADPRADIYSLGIIFYEMLSGRTPFADKEMVAVMTRHMTESPPPLPLEIDPALAALVMQMLAKRPSERPQTAQEAAARLDSFLELPIASRSSTSQQIALFHSAPAFASENGPFEPTSPSMDSPRAHAARPSLPAWLRRSIRVGTRRVPLVVALLVSLAVMVLTLLFVSLAGWLRPGAEPTARNVGAGASPAAKSANSGKTNAPDPVLKQARLGDKVALHTLANRPMAEMDAEHWTSLARGRARNRQWADALEAYGHALDKAPALARDGELLSDVRSAASDPEASPQALAFAAERLKAAGLDIIYDVWSAAASGQGTQNDARAAKKLLDDPQIRAHASRALKVTLELNEARGCADYRRVLPKVANIGDDRCLRTLRRLTHDRGCGLFGLRDCYACLRNSGTLPQAIEAVKNRPGPTFR